MSADAKWYVVHTYSAYENKVAANIEKMVENRKMQDQILDVKIPTETVTEIKNGKEHEVEHKLFPGYVLVKAAVTYDENNEPSMSDDAWFVIRNTRGVTGFVGPESKATPITDEEALAWGVEKKSISVDYKVGDTVRITDERLEGFTGTVTKIDLENEMVYVSVSAFFGKETTVELDLDQVELEEIK